MFDHNEACPNPLSKEELQSAALRTHIGRSKTRIVAAKSRLTDPKIAATRRKTKTGAYFSSLLVLLSHKVALAAIVESPSHVDREDGG